VQEKEAKKKLEQDQKDEKERKRLELFAVKEKERLEREAKKVEEDKQKLQQQAALQKSEEPVKKGSLLQFFAHSSYKKSVTPEPADQRFPTQGAETEPMTYYRKLFRPFFAKATVSWVQPEKRKSNEALDASFSAPALIPYLESQRGKKIVSRRKKISLGDTTGHLKLFHFTENYRPTYYGTWTKKSKTVKPRKPLAKDENLAYDVDSDEEWGDEDEPGESLSGSEDDRSEIESAAGDSADEDGWLEEDDQAEEMNRRRKVKLEKLVPVTLGVFFQDTLDFSVSGIFLFFFFLDFFKENLTKHHKQQQTTTPE